MIDHYDRETNTLTRMPTFAPGTKRRASTYRAPDWRADWLVPVAIALTVGVFCAVVTGWLWWESNFLPDWLVGLAFFGGTGVMGWAMFRRHFDNLQIHDESTAVEFPPAPAIAAAPTVHLDLSINQAGRDPVFASLDLPCSDETLTAVAAAMLAGDKLTESKWAGIARGRPFSEAGLAKFKTLLLNRNMAEMVSADNPRLGIRLTNTGTQLMTEWIAQTSASSVEPQQPDADDDADAPAAARKKVEWAK